MNPRIVFSSFLAVTMLTACASVPTGPSVAVMPGAGKNFDQFRADDATCRQFAQDRIGGRTTSDAAVQSGVTSAVVGTAIGATAGALLGGHQGAGVGAGAGLLLGSASGVGAAQGSAGALQRQYDTAYMQCMYANGENVPVQGTRVVRRYRAAALPPPPPNYAPPPQYAPPPPPPGYQPPPPPDAAAE